MIIEAILKAFSKLVHGITDMSEETACERLDALAEQSDAKNWRTSITDLAKLLELDGSSKGRKALWKDLGFTDTYIGNADQNTALRRTLFKTVREHGIKLPAVS